VRGWGLALCGSLLLTGLLLFALANLVLPHTGMQPAPVPQPIELSVVTTQAVMTAAPQVLAPAGVSMALAQRLLAPLARREPPPSHPAELSASTQAFVTPQPAEKKPGVQSDEVSTVMPDKRSTQYPLYRPLPEYPARARLMHRQGVVKLRFAVNAAGGVEDVQLLQGDPELARAAITALRQWRYSPLETDPASKPKAVKVLTLIFRLNSGVQALAAE